MDKARPSILGALLDAMVVGLRRLPDTKLEKLPRMADFAVWASACEQSFAPPGAFETAYAANRATSAASLLEADAVATAVRTLSRRGPWQGTATDLLPELAAVAGVFAYARTWPATPRMLAGALRRTAPALRRDGVELAFERDGAARKIRITAASTLSLPDRVPVIFRRRR
jgi:hypothetical protein